jgi:hypothetical protein
MDSPVFPAKTSCRPARAALGSVRFFAHGRRAGDFFAPGSGLGDIICTFPAAMELKKRHPGVTFSHDCHPDFTVVQLENEP